MASSYCVISEDYDRCRADYQAAFRAKLSEADRAHFDALRAESESSPPHRCYELNRKIQKIKDPTNMHDPAVPPTPLDAYPVNLDVNRLPHNSGSLW